MSDPSSLTPEECSALEAAWRSVPSSPNDLPVFVADLVRAALAAVPRLADSPMVLVGNEAGRHIATLLRDLGERHPEKRDGLLALANDVEAKAATSDEELAFQLGRTESAAEVSRLTARVEELEKERDRLRQFVGQFSGIGEWAWSWEFDGGDVQAEAERLGLIVEGDHDPETCDEDCPCDGSGRVYWLAWSEEGRRILAAAAPKEGTDDTL